MKRPIVIITILFVCGISFGYVTRLPVYFILGISLLLWTACLTCFFSDKLKIFVLPCLWTLFVTLSMAYYDCRVNHLSVDHVARALTTQKSLQRITGIIIDPPIILDGNTMNSRLLQKEQKPRKSYEKISFLVRAKRIETVSGWKDISGVMRVTLYLSQNDVLNINNTLPVLYKLVYGQGVELFGYAFLPKSSSNPHEFNYKSYLQRQTPSIRCLMTVAAVNNVKMLESHHNNWIYTSVYTIKNFLNDIIYLHTFSNSAPLISSMLLGNRVDLSNEQIDSFMKTGVIHFIAISGFNVGIVVFTVLLPLRLLGVNQSVSTGIALCIVILYAFLTGLSPPVLRASIMAIVFLCSFLVRRQWDITSGIFTAIFFILVRNPPDLFNVGFQLSVLATMGIVYGAARIEGVLFKTALFVESLQARTEQGRFFSVKKYLRKSFCISLAAWIATLPLTAYYFHLFTPFICVTNLIVFPLFWIIIVCGIVLLTLGTICPPLAGASAWVASHADVALESLVSTLASLPYTYFYVSGPSRGEIVIYCLFVLLFLYHDHISVRFTRITICCLLSANILIFSNIFRSSNQSLRITCLDVGHGGAIFIQFPNGKNILYDVGSWQNYDAGRYIVAPFLWGQKIKTIDLVILSHEHEDHWNGLSSIIERFRIGSVYSQPHLFTSEPGQRILSLLRKKDISAASLSCGETLKGFEPAVIKILNPSFFFPKAATPNNDSCVLRIEYFGHSILLCGDIQEQGIKSIVSKPSEVKSDIIQIPHHGSFSNTMEMLVNTVRPLYAFINSSDSITSHKTLNILQRHHITTLQTHKEGAVTFILDKNGITYSHFCK